MKTLLTSILCAAWFFALLCPTTWYGDPAVRILLIVIIDIVLLLILLWHIYNWIIKRKDGVILVALAMVLACHVVLPSIASHEISVIVAIASIVCFFVVLLVFKLRTGQNKSTEKQKLESGKK
ncbi:hypothetical protein OH491_25285 [Termitidicoccus mucosus]|uniref:hypothetical protein n=1 Tax=Termitidicoccus mucosus TaxID=1184151 RepID=UPI0011AB8D99